MNPEFNVLDTGMDLLLACVHIKRFISDYY